MNTLERLKGMLVRLGMLKIYSAWNCVILTVIFTQVLTTAWFLLFFDTKTKTQYVESTYLTIYFSCYLLWYVVCIKNNKKMCTLFDDLNVIVAKRLKNPLVTDIYSELNDKIESVTALIQSLINKVLLSYILASIFMTVHKYIASSFSNDSFEPILPVIYPFDVNSPVRYIGCLLIQSSLMFIVTNLYTTIVAMVVGLCLFACSFVSDIEKNLDDINKNFATSSEELTAERKIELIEKMNGVAQFHSDARHFVDVFSHISGPLVVHFISASISAFVAIAFRLNEGLKSGNILDIFRIIIVIIALHSTLYVFCHFGESITKRYEDLGNAFYDVAWYNLPLDVQKMFPTMITLSQKRVYIQGFAHTRSTRQVFIKILLKKFLYLLFLRSLK